LLAEVGRDLPGAVEVTGALEGTDVVEAQTSPVAGELRFSLAGIQLKLSMLLTGERFAFPARGQTGRWIVKIPGRTFVDLPEVEAATMSWARAAGLETPRFHVLPVEKLEGVDPAVLGDPGKAFAIERFDRTSSGRVHQEDFAQALGVLPRDKYGPPAGVSYDGLARLVRDAAGADAQGSFIDRVAFVVASGNDDAHLKNWSFQWGHDHRPWLSPCYDMVSTITWASLFGRKGSDATLALPLGRTRRYVEIDRARIARFAARARSTGGEERFMTALERVRSAWSSIADRAPEAMRKAVGAHWRAVPILRDVGALPG
jgi:serine/threonine-protein kinase HipA